jgi:hypothetical protein
MGYKYSIVEAPRKIDWLGRLLTRLGLVESDEPRLAVKPGFFEKNPNGDIEIDHAVVGIFRAPQDENDTPHIFARIDQTPEAMARTFFHEVSHCLQMVRRFDEVPCDLSAEDAERMAAAFSRAAPSGDTFEAVMRETLERLVDWHIEHEYLDVASDYAEQLSQFNPTRAQELQREIKDAEDVYLWRGLSDSEKHYRNKILNRSIGRETKALVAKESFQQLCQRAAPAVEQFEQKQAARDLARKKDEEEWREIEADWHHWNGNDPMPGQ